MDDRLVRKIYAFVAEGMSCLSEMERHLRIFVEKELFINKTLSDETNRRFYPTRVDIRNHMYRATVQFQHPKSTKKTWNINFRNGESSILQITSSFDQQRHAARHRLIVMKRAAIDHCYMYTRQNGNVICCRNMEMKYASLMQRTRFSTPLFPLRQGQCWLLCGWFICFAA